MAKRTRRVRIQLQKDGTKNHLGGQTWSFEQPLHARTAEPIEGETRAIKWMKMPEGYRIVDIIEAKTDYIKKYIDKETGQLIKF